MYKEGRGGKRRGVKGGGHRQMSLSGQAVQTLLKENERSQSPMYLQVDTFGGDISEVIKRYGRWGRGFGEKRDQRDDLW